MNIVLDYGNDIHGGVIMINKILKFVKKIDEKKENNYNNSFYYSIPLFIVAFLFAGLYWMSGDENLSLKENNNIIVENSSISSDEKTYDLNNFDNKVSELPKGNKERRTSLVESKNDSNKEKTSYIESVNSNKLDVKEVVESISENVDITKKLIFQPPVYGETVKEFAINKLIYSNTLNEWCTHLGIDIYGKVGTKVLASEDGVVDQILDDPRMGRTIIIKHSKKYKTIYSNLSDEVFVKEGEKVKKGKCIGSIGRTAKHESLDKDHLHFEMLEDEKHIDPQTLILR